jgi:hypothetical protein
VRKAVALFRENGIVNRKICSGKPNRRTAKVRVVENTREIMEATPFTSIRRVRQIRNK